MGPRLAALCARGLSSAGRGFALPLAEPQRLDFQYRYAIWQLEYSRNQRFHPAQVWEEVLQKRIERTRAPLEIKTVETLLGRRPRPPTKERPRAGRRGYEVTQEGDAASGEGTVGRVSWGSVGPKVYKARHRTVIAALRGLAPAPEGFTTAEVAPAGRGRTGWNEAPSPTRRAAYELAKVQGKGLGERVPGRRRYECRPEPLRVWCG